MAQQLSFFLQLFQVMLSCLVARLSLYCFSSDLMGSARSPITFSM